MLSLPHRCILIVACLAILPSCSDGASGGAQAIQADAREFSQADKIAARALSLSNAGARTEEAESPQEQAALCSEALEALSARLRESGTLSDTQLQALGEAKAIYDRQAGGGSRSQSPGADLAIEAGDDAGAGGSPAAQARIAIGCLQDLQAAG